MSRDAYSIEIFDGSTAAKGDLAQSGTATSPTYEVNAYRPLGNFASQLKITGSGVVDVELFMSINGSTFVSYGKLYEGYTEGEYLESHGMAVCLKFYIVVTETGTAAANVTYSMGIQ